MAGADIDALIEDGLTRYGRGDLDGALLVWEEALGIDPDNEQANSYVDYVRQNYDLLTGGDLAADEGPVPFGIEDDEYSVEIIEGAVLAPATAQPATELDEGWFIDEGHVVPEPTRVSQMGITPMTASPVVVIEAEEPPSFETQTHEYIAAKDLAGAPTVLNATIVPADLGAGGDPDTEMPDVTVEGVRALPDDDDDDDEPEIEVSVPVAAPVVEPMPVPVAASVPTAVPVALKRGESSSEFSSGGHTPGFDAADSTPVGFAAQLTDVKVRDLGFVTAKKPEPPPPQPPPPPPADSEPTTSNAPALARVDSFPEIEVSRPDGDATEAAPPIEPEPEPVEAAPAAAPAAAAPPPPAAAPAPEIEKPPMDTHPPEPKPTPRTPTLDKIEGAIAAADILAAPDAETVQTRAIPPAAAFAPEPTATAQAATASAGETDDETDAELLAAPRNPHSPDTDDVILPPSPSAPTRELPMAMQMPVMADERNRTRDLQWEIAQDPRKQTQRLPLAQQVDISAPTRELGIRPTRQDIVTVRVDPRSARVAVPTSPPSGGAGDMTRADIQSPFDPIDARGAQILDDVDVHAPATEAREDRTRRRITALIEKAAEWQRKLDLEKSVTAIDLALAEDPNSALAQKLIHRNREAIMSVFQSYIGDLARAPMLARPLHELASAPISPRAAFLLSRVDGSMSIDEILDVSGMPRLEAFRYLCQLLLRGILK